MSQGAAAKPTTMLLLWLYCCFCSLLLSLSSPFPTHPLAPSFQACPCSYSCLPGAALRARLRAVLPWSGSDSWGYCDHAGGHTFLPRPAADPPPPPCILPTASLPPAAWRDCAHEAVQRGVGCTTLQDCVLFSCQQQHFCCHCAHSSGNCWNLWASQNRL